MQGKYLVIITAMLLILFLLNIITAITDAVESENTGKQNQIIICLLINFYWGRVTVLHVPVRLKPRFSAVIRLCCQVTHGGSLAELCNIQCKVE